MKNLVTIMFHSVGLDRYKWAYPWISCSITKFEKKIARLRKEGYDSVFFSDIKKGYKKKTLCLTFDDGYLDNWIHVYPVLKKEGFKGTIFVSTDFVDPRNLIRTCYVPGSINDLEHNAASCCAGFLSWPEMIALEQSGVMEIQSHSQTHTWYFKGPKVVDFWRPGIASERNAPIWMLWNLDPESKPFYLTEAPSSEKKIPYGTPIYESGKSLETRRYFPDVNVNDLMINYVDTNGGEAFFEKPDWRQILNDTLSEYVGKKQVNDHYESQEDYKQRIYEELSASKKLLEEKLNKEITALCWPGGGVTDEVVEIAKGAGYKRFTLPSSWKRDYKKGKYTDFVPRNSSGDRIVLRGRDLGEQTLTEFIMRLRAAFMPYWVYKIIIRLHLSLRLLGSLIGLFK